MMLSLDRDQADVLRDVLQTALTQLRIESARADAHDYREMIHRRERIIEGLLGQVVAGSTASTAHVG
ncbi:MAG TPA: hypothetical protein VFK02_09685 [Kofleriaceae bacterium]|nr:hypothetical protein [Kofleriaceae bacterium]